MNGDLVELVEQFSKMDFKSVTVSKDSNTSTYSVVFTSGVTVTIQKVEDTLNLMLLMPPTFKGVLAFFLIKDFQVKSLKRVRFSDGIYRDKKIILLARLLKNRSLFSKTTFIYVEVRTFKRRIVSCFLSKYVFVTQ